MLPSPRRSSRLPVLRATAIPRVRSAVLRVGLGAALAAAPVPAATEAPAEAARPAAVARAGSGQAGSSGVADGCAPALALGDVGVAAGGQFRLMGNRSNFGSHDRTAGPG